MYIYIYIYTDMYIYIYRYISVYIYRYIYIYIHIIYIYIFIYMRNVGLQVGATLGSGRTPPAAGGPNQHCHSRGAREQRPLRRDAGSNVEQIRQSRPFKTVTATYKTVAATYKTVAATYKAVTTTYKTVKTRSGRHQYRDARGPREQRPLRRHAGS